MLHARRLLIVLCSVIWGVSTLLAQQSTDMASAADAAYKNKNWSEAEKLYQQLTESDPTVARHWYRLAVSAQGQGDHQKALEAFERTRGKGIPASLLDYNVAAVHASMGDSEKAFAELSAAVKAGFAQPDQMASDADLQSLRNDSRFATLVEQAKHNQAPCNYTAENRQFDFWVGEWNVIPTSGGPPQGSSRIEKELGNCVIWENWTSLGGSYAGKSYNVYNPNLKRWEQFWVDNVGGMIHFHGGLKEGVMDYWTDDIPQPDGTKLRRHLQFFNQGPDKVRQFSQGSTDGGKSWHTEYDFTYLRNTPATTGNGT
jgi:tetratricopeptide (TPR) repeat protein